MKTMITALIVVCGSSAWAAAPTDKQLLGAKTVGVLPVISTGPSQAAATLAVTIASVSGADNKSSFDPNKVAKVDPNQGFGFAGQATSNDIKLLTYGFLLATLALDSEGTPEFKAQAQKLAGARELLAPLVPEVVKAIDQYLTGAQAGTFDVQALATALAAGQRGLIAGPARGHGYLVAGLWTGLSVMAITSKAVSPDLIAMAPPLATMFEEDAQFEGADKKVAASLRELAKLLGNTDLSAATYVEAMGRMFSIKEDAP